MDPSEWSIDQVIAQLCDKQSQLHTDLVIKPVLDLETLESALRSNDIDGEALLSMEDANVKDDLGISSFGQRREVRKIILQLRSQSHFEKITPEPAGKRPLQTSDPETSGRTPDSSKRRRIQPENISIEPLHKSLPATGEEEGENLPDEEDLEDHWLDLLDRYPDDSNDEILRPYGESDNEKELDSDDPLGDELEDQEEQEESTKARLSQEAISDTIDSAVENFRHVWTVEKRAEKHKKALRRWMQAAKAGTRKPQQVALQNELDRYETRFTRLRTHIADIAREYLSLDEVRRNCLNLQATVEDMMEEEYYLDCLNNNAPPQRPVQAKTREPKVVLLADEESLASSEGEPGRETSGEEDMDGDMMSVGSGSGVSLTYDPFDSDWHPEIPRLIDQFKDVPNLKEMVDDGENVESDSSPMQVEPPDLQHEYSASTPETPVHLPKIPHESQVQYDTDDSDLDRLRLPQSRYKQLGASKDNAIELGSSPSASGAEQGWYSDASIRTPPLNATTPIKTASNGHRPSQMAFPSISDTRQMKWADVGRDDHYLALCKIVYRHSRTNAKDVLEYIQGIRIDELSGTLRYRIGQIQEMPDSPDDDPFDDGPLLWTLFFVVYVMRKGYRSVWDLSEESLDIAWEATSSHATHFDRILKALLRFYISTNTDGKPGSSLVSSSPPGRTRQSSVPHTPVKVRKSPVGSDTEAEMEVPSTMKHRKRQVEESQEASMQQRDDRDRVEAQEERRQLLLERFQAQPSSSGAPQIVINTVEPLLYLDSHISMRIKEHQVTGVQFIWRELIEDEKHQGCLLAHTMGLGKTMQVISFIVTLAQANHSSNQAIRALIPQKLQSGKILIMCPASLVDNWYDEILMWTPAASRDLIGGLYKLTGVRNKKIQIVREWAQTSGILILPYETLRSLLHEGPRNDVKETAFLKEALLEGPAVVVGDEAHKMKNAKSTISRVAQTFNTTTRIALTGSPLNNHLEEYHTMISWIAPGYLGTIVQFRDKYSEPIERGLYEESTRYEKRKCLERLYVLKRDLAPKIDRKDISAIAKDMPQKTEFFITVPLTQLQKQIYTILVEHILSGIRKGNGNAPKSTNAQLWSWLSILSWLNNHPSCLIRKLQEKDEDAYQAAIDNIDDDAPLPADLDLRGTDIAAMLPKFLDCFKALDLHPINDREDPGNSTRALVTQRLVLESIKQNEKILIFSHSIPTLDYLQAMLEGMECPHLRIDGSTRLDQRQTATKNFNETDSYKVFLISTRAGGLGLNLQGANRVIIYDFGFNPSWEEQAIGRAYRLGQKKPVYVYRFQAGGTFEEAIHNKSIFKTQLFSRVVDQKNVVRHASKKIEDYLFVPKEVERNPDLDECLSKDALLKAVVEADPDTIRNLILTETFQREDEDDELTAEERQDAEKEVERERAFRSDPALYQKLTREFELKEQNRRMVAAAQVPVQSGGQTFPGGAVNFNSIFDLHGTYNALRAAGELPERPKPEHVYDAEGNVIAPPVQVVDLGAEDAVVGNGEQVVGQDGAANGEQV